MKNSWDFFYLLVIGNTYEYFYGIMDNFKILCPTYAKGNWADII